MPHQAQVLASRPRLAWLEVHPENYMADESALAELESFGAHYPLSLHAVGLSLGSAEGVDQAHLERLRRLVEGSRPALVSDHLSWSTSGGQYLPDLLPLPYTEEALHVVCRNVAQVQDALGRQILVENPSTYLEVRRLGDTRGGISRRRGPRHRLRGAVRREQCIRQRLQPAPRRRPGAQRLVPCA